MSIQKKLIIVYATSKNGVIGNANSLPWKIKDDLIFFKKETVGNTCLMGRKTWESIPGDGLPNRKNIILTTQKDYSAPAGVKIINSFLDIREKDIEGNLYVIGGASVYSIFENMADEFIVTEVDAEIEGDTSYIPNLSKFKETTIQKIDKNNDNEFSAVIKRYSRG